MYKTTKKDLDQKKGTIAHFLVSHQEEIWAYQDDWKAMKDYVLKLLQRKEIRGNPATPQAIDILSKATGSHFLSTLTTYMFGLRANG